jgi:UDP-glucose 4-epimerase
MATTWITGAYGFIGRHLARAASEFGDNVLGLGRGAWQDADALRWGVRGWVNGDITLTNLDFLATLSGIPDAIFHLAGGSSVGLSMENPEEDFFRTAASSVRLLEWVRLRAPQCRLVLASSAAVYGAGHSSPIAEDAAMKPYSPYGYHKRTAELLFESYARNFGLATATVRLFSIYGDGLRKQLLWDLCCRLQSSPDKLLLAGNGNELRDFFHVRDAVKLLLVGSQYASSQGFVVNGGTGCGITVREVAQDLCAAWGLDVDVQFSGKKRAGDPNFLVADVGRAIALGCTAKVSWADGVAEYVAWYKRQAGLGNVA